jgi:hypothetical protein
LSDRARQLRFPQLGDECPVSSENALVLLVRALEAGRTYPTEHFKKQGRERNFTTVDAEHVIRAGKLMAEPAPSVEFDNWVFRLQGKCENRLLEIRVALDFHEDLDSPRMFLITGICKGSLSMSRRKKNESHTRKEDD